MITYVQKIGNSLGVYIPKTFAEDLHLEHRSAVEIKEENGVLTIAPVKPHIYSLDDLVAQITPDNLHGEVNTGNVLGNEVW